MGYGKVGPMGEMHRHPSLLQKVKKSRRDKLELHLQELKKTTVEPSRAEEKPRTADGGGR